MSDTIPSEHLEQVRFISWFRKTQGTRIFAIPNGGHRHIAVAAKMKATGQSPGVPDLFIPAWNVWVEMKRSKGGRLSPEQKDWIEYLTGAGHTAIVGYGFEDARDKILAMQK